mgnify:CR=1 FL=1
MAGCTSGAARVGHAHAIEPASDVTCSVRALLWEAAHAGGGCHLCWAPHPFLQEGTVDPTPAGMNHEQHEAVHRVLAAKDYVLVQGMPGAGKTTTIGGPVGY